MNNNTQNKTEQKQAKIGLHQNMFYYEPISYTL